MRIAIEGCAHGELQTIYETIGELEQKESFKVDLLLCCGDFQATRNLQDLQTMAVSPKYRDICTFYKYYSGELQAPILTIFIGGNHEASNHLQELPYGGWVAPNIYYLGYAGVVNINGLRIAGLSGIYKGYDYLRGHYEHSPFDDESKRSVYHIRQLEVFRLKQLSGRLHIVLSHDWPRGIYNFGNKKDLLRFKPFLKEEIHNNTLGSTPCEELLHQLQPLYWFAAHMHCKFAAIVPHAQKITAATGHQNENNENLSINCTKFLALDKCLPQKRFLQIINIEHSANVSDHIGKENERGEKKDMMPHSLQLEYDLEWLTILYLTNHLLNIQSSYYYLPNENSVNNTERYNFTPTSEEMQEVREKFKNDLKIPENFRITAKPYNPLDRSGSRHYQQPRPHSNIQTIEFCKILGIDDPLRLIMSSLGHKFPAYPICNDNQKRNSKLLQDDEIDIGNSASLFTRGETDFPGNQSPLEETNTSESRELDIPPTPMESCSLDEANLEGVTDTETDTHTPTDESISNNQVGNSDKPPIKKFKIRNQDIYRNQSDDT